MTIQGKYYYHYYDCHYYKQEGILFYFYIHLFVIMNICININEKRGELFDKIIEEFTRGALSQDKKENCEDVAPGAQFGGGGGC